MSENRGVTRFGRTRKIHLKRWVTGSVSQQGKVAYIFNIQKKRNKFLPHKQIIFTL